MGKPLADERNGGRREDGRVFPADRPEEAAAHCRRCAAPEAAAGAEPQALPPFPWTRNIARNRDILDAAEARRSVPGVVVLREEGRRPPLRFAASGTDFDTQQPGSAP